MAPDFVIENDAELKSALRDITSYGDVPGELPASQLDGVLDEAKREMYGRTDSTEWYDDNNYGQALLNWTAIEAKAAVENINIVSYNIADEQISLSNADPDDSQQIQLWMGKVSRALKRSDVEFGNAQDLGFKNTSNYIG